MLFLASSVQKILTNKSITLGTAIGAGMNIYQAVSDYSRDISCGRTFEAFTSASHTGQYLWYGTAVCGSDDRSHQTGIGEGDGEVSDRDHAGHVYSGRGRLVDQLGYIMRDPRPHRPDHCCDNSYRDGSHRLGISDHDTKGR